MPEPILKVEHLRIEFDTRRGILVAVDDISFNVMPGEVFGIVGESGAGKSLTGQAIIGLLEPPGQVEDRNENMIQDADEGDIYTEDYRTGIDDWIDDPNDLSPFNVDNDKNPIIVELPIAHDPGDITEDM